MIVGYFLGVLLPCNILPQINENTITRGEFFYYTVTAIGVFATVLTVIVALFKDDLIGLFKRVKLDINLSGSNKLQEDIEDNDGTKKASKYYSTAIIENSGNIHADNCELYIDRIVHISDSKSNILLSESKPLEWAGKRDRIYIPSQGKIPLHLFELLPAQKNSTPGAEDGKVENSHVKLSLYGFSNIVVEEGVKGEWKCTYSIHSSSMQKPIKFEVTITWNGAWEDRLSEMSNNLEVVLDSNV